MKILGIIPSRYASTRFPGKPLAMIDGKSMIQRVYEQAGKAVSLDKVVVATDDTRIFKLVESFGGDVVMTSVNHPNGTSRCLEVLEQINENYNAVVNIQGDEPFIDPEQINQTVQLFENSKTEIGTLVKKIQSQEELFNPNVVKAVFDRKNNALLFSRQAIPFLRTVPKEEWLNSHDFYKHIGLYAYRFDVLKEIVSLSPTALEKAESLEQLRWLENGFAIKVEITTKEAVSIDTPEDLLKLTNKP
jgi:3-deoxy-manno-octulosonate cytidylyltransferase (CMP-KDO synthetase)